jgi:hypothetical protein
MPSVAFALVELSAAKLVFLNKEKTASPVAPNGPSLAHRFFDGVREGAEME